MDIEADQKNHVNLRRSGGIDEAQVLNYLRITRLTKAVLLDFGTRSLEYEPSLSPLEESARICVNLRRNILRRGRRRAIPA
jgi:hypothetical protein